MRWNSTYSFWPDFLKTLQLDYLVNTYIKDWCSFEEYKEQNKTQDTHKASSDNICGRYCTFTVTPSEFYSRLEFWTRMHYGAVSVFFPPPISQQGTKSSYVYTTLLYILDSRARDTQRLWKLWFHGIFFFIWLRSHRCWVWWTVCYPDSFTVNVHWWAIVIWL